MAPIPKSVLWVDDEVELLESHCIFLREKGYEVQCASNADDALEMLRGRSFDVMLLDEQMPGRRGLDSLKDIKELAPNLPYVLVTKSEEDATLKEALGRSRGRSSSASGRSSWSGRAPSTGAAGWSASRS